MAGRRLLSALLAVFMIVAFVAVAYHLGKGRNDNAPEVVRAVVGERLASIDGINDRLKRLEGEFASLRRALPVDTGKEKRSEALDSDRWAAVESDLSTLKLRIKGLEEDPIRRGESFLESENAEMRREGINVLRRVARFDSKTRAAIRALLHDSSSRVREQAAQILRDLKDKESAPEMKELLADADARTRRRAVEALGAMEARDAAREIGRNLISDPDDRVRIAAADVLGRLKAQEAEEFLTEALKDRDNEVRGEAIASLGEIGATAAAPLLRAIYDQDPGSHRVRLALALKSLGDDAPLQKEVARLSEALKSETDERVRQRTQRELAMLTRNSAQ